MEDDRSMVYIGNYCDEEYYINLEDKGLGGWSFNGLRPETEETLKEIARETEITEFYTIPPELEKYIDHERFEEDMVDDWYDHHDVQCEQERDGTTYYLGSGSGTDIQNFFKEHKIKTYETFTRVFDEVNLTEKLFYELIIILKAYEEDQTKGYELFLAWTKQIPNHPEQD